MHDEVRQPTEEELQAAFEEQMRHIRVEDVILQTVATLVNLAGRRLGLARREEEEGGPRAGATGHRCRACAAAAVPRGAAGAH